MTCYACEQAATQQCSRCAKAYCPAHGDDPATGSPALCADCLNPLNAAPSNTVFRTFLFALLIGSVVALWLLIRPPDLPGEAESVRPQPTQSDLTPGPSEPPGGEPTPTPAGGETPAPEETPAPTEAPSTERVEYTVVENDTWFGIADAYGVDAAELAAVNGLTLEDFIQPGDVLVIP